MQRRKAAGKKTNKGINSPGLRYLYDRYIGEDPEQQALFEEHQANAEIAQQVFDLRTKAGLTQRGLAKQVGTTASVICRLEDADYDGHSLSMLRRIAAALNKRVEIRFLPTRRRLQAT
jgi:DNA-binding XRE family transcriptional regulator